MALGAYQCYTLTQGNLLAISVGSLDRRKDLCLKQQQNKPMIFLPNVPSTTLSVLVMCYYPMMSISLMSDFVAK